MNGSIFNFTYDEFSSYQYYWEEETNYFVDVVYLLIATVGCIAFVGNAFIIGVALSTVKIRKKRSNYFIMNLALQDAFVGFTVATIYIITYKSAYTDLNISILTFCSYTYTALLLSSMLAILMIAIERCFAIIAPFQHRLYVTKFTLSVAIFIDWLVFGGMYIFLKYFEGSPLVMPIFMLCIISTNFLIYLVIFLSVKIHSSKIQRVCNRPISRKKQMNRDARLITTFAILLGILITCFVPFWVLDILLRTSSSPAVNEAIFVTTVLIPLNSAVNMFVYWWRIPEFRTAYKRVFSCKKCEEKQSTTQNRSANNNKQHTKISIISSRI
ncbi:adrenocorticotropic hormone receptor-like [Anneissia japonica]|uniref:adrenocorticotropic hormone receptor-like n=1 Tax=Anneissia japonica TaxID=1529436 RepID=UPI0014257CBD|nr:adrenocorticotropic hormone receptor-like [Anneissia japonica]XP_033122995.1 adrenocorticotropic hormone receptor-like [Anneissia japonica]XP_033122996.1 adrenocorticotropic hormone receptor-like [Anneissia japonica]XP_033122997.1 adrenocorticotropic hormone receptor-like [Anneissia japonica]XP_033122998.1 adrenocorticotropic hormone receptor-like [Anneissia japonica]